MTTEALAPDATSPSARRAEPLGSKTGTTAVPVKSLSRGELRAEASHARAELASTLDAIEYKFNLPRQLKITTRRLTHRLRRLRNENPAALLGIAAGAAAVAGGAAWLAVKAVERR